MNRIEPRDRSTLGEYEPLFELIEKNMGFVPNSMLTMSHWPPLLEQFAALAGTVLGQGQVDPGLKQLIAYVSSNAAGCQYCQAHTSHSANRRGIALEKLEHAFEFETHELFDPAERAALRIALHASQIPNAATDQHFADLALHYSEQEKVEIMAVISLFGFLNRWNDSLATELETAPTSFAKSQLTGWSAGKHGQ